MKYLSLFLLSIVLFVGLSYGGKAFFGMDDGMQMGSIECVNHCIDAASVPGAMSAPLVVAFFLFVIVVREILRFAQNDMDDREVFFAYRRRTEPIHLFSLKQILSPVMLRE